MLFLMIALISAPGSWKTIGKPNEWPNTVAATMFKDKLYSVDKAGTLFITTVEAGTWAEKGKLGIGKIKWLFAGNDKLWAINTKGDLYSIDPATAALTRSARDWRDTAAASAVGGTLYTVETSGRLYATDLTTLLTKPIGKPEDFEDVKHLMATEGGLFSVEKEGTMYAIDRVAGTWRTVGRQYEFSSTTRLSAVGGFVYRIDKGGRLYEIEPKTATVRQIGSDDFADVVALVPYKQTLLSFEADGSLYELTLK